MCIVRYFLLPCGRDVFVVSIYVFGLIVGMIIPTMKYENMVKGLGGFVSGLSSWFNDKSRSLAVKLVGRTSCRISMSHNLIL